MSEEIKVTITEQIEKVNLTITEAPKILVNVLNVATVDPSVANARNTAEAAAESASTSAEVAMTVLQQAQDIADTLPTMVGDEVTTQLGALTTDNLSEGANNLYFTDARAEAVVNALTTDSLPEGASNLYFTNARALSAAQGSLDLKAPLASPVFTGEPEAPTVASALDSSDKIASTGFVQAVALNKVAGPESSVDNTLPRFDGVTGKIIKGSGVEVDDTDNVSGINALTAESVNLDKFSISEVVNSALTGQNATLAVDSSKIILTNASLISIESITSSLANISCTIVNRTGNAITLLNNIGANGVVLPNSKDLRIDIDSSVRVMKSAEAGDKFIIDGGAGSGSGGGQTLSTLMQLTADESLTDWTASPSFQISKANPLQGDASYSIAMTAGDKATHNGVAVNPVFRQRTLALVMSYKGVSFNPIIGTAKIILRDQADAIIYESALPTITSEIQKFGDRVFIPSTVTSVKFEIESTSTVADEYIQFDNIELSADLLKSVDIEDRVQYNLAFFPTAITTTTDLSTVSFSRSGGAGLYKLTSQGVVVTSSCILRVSASSYRAAGSASSNGMSIYLNGQRVAPQIVRNSNTDVEMSVTGSWAFPVEPDDKVTFTINTSTENSLSIFATARTKSIVAPTDQVTERSIAFRWRSPAQATEANLSATGQIGDFVTGQYAINTNTLTQCTTRPTQTDADMSVNGLRIYTRAYNAASTAALPTRFSIKIAEPNQMSACDLKLFKDASKGAVGNLDTMLDGNQMRGLTFKEFNPSTGVVTLDAGFCPGNAGTITSRVIPYLDNSTATNGYICFTASKLAQGVAIPTPKVAILKDVKPSGTAGGTFTAGAWQTRTLNTVEGNTELVSLASNAFTLGKGQYVIEVEAPAIAVGSHNIVLLNDDTGMHLFAGMTTYSAASSEYASPNSKLVARVNLTTPTKFKIQHRGTVSKASTGLGIPASFGVPEVYTTVKITKLD